MGESIGTYEVVDEGDCWSLCQETPRCEFYSYDSSFLEGFCFLYSSCPVIDESCSTCTTSENECPLLSCQVPGECLGVLVMVVVSRSTPLECVTSLFRQIDEFNTRGDEGECAAACVEQLLCNWYTYFTDSGKCVLYNTCQVTEDNCEDCFTSEKGCGDDSQGE